MTARTLKEFIQSHFNDDEELDVQIVIKEKYPHRIATDKDRESQKVYCGSCMQQCIHHGEDRYVICKAFTIH